MSDFTSFPRDKKSTVKLTLLDPLGRGISGLKYHVSEGENIFIRGVTNDKGEGRPFTSTMGVTLDVYVERFESGEMKKIKSLVPTAELFSVKLLSSKIIESVTLEAAKGDPGVYRRKTYIASPGDTLDSIAQKSGVAVAELAKLNGLNATAVLHTGQTIKIPTIQTSAEEKSKKLNGTGGAAPGNPGDGSSLKPGLKKGDGKIPIQEVPKELTSARGGNGTPKTSVGMTCGHNACLKVGMTSPLIEELNIRLTGFGGSVKKDVAVDQFTIDTESAIKNFQRDYMNVPETGKVCADVILALDEFAEKFRVAIDQMKCTCGHCAGFGQQYENSLPVQIFKTKDEPYKGIEYPGMHKGLVWLFRASLFYTSVKDKRLGYSFLKIASGYRCWNDNKIHARNTFNHMGNALDLQFSRQTPGTRCSGQDLENLRKNIFIDRLGAKMRWETPFHPSLEAATDGATSWVHVDVRNFGSKFKLSKYYTSSQDGLDGENLMNMAKRWGMLRLVNCGGIPTLNSFSKSQSGIRQ